MIEEELGVVLGEFILQIFARGFGKSQASDRNFIFN
jgi:hypothetical protein